ncbi:MAG: cyclic nucleotide-binding domain-containing protein [Desulfobacteraceae bacterium]|nr:cyclic nucleotide-binding domain-containing protein [Desulfobacteraceae bacterium]
MQIIEDMEWEEILGIIERIEFFKNFSLREIKKIIKINKNVLFYRVGELIIRQGTDDNCFYILVSGSVTITKGDSSLPIAKFEPGDLFGEIAFLTNSPRTANAIADETAIVIKIDKTQFEKLSPKIREKIKDVTIEKLVVRLNRMTRAFLSLYY